MFFGPQIGSLSVGPEADAQFVQLYVIFMNQLVTVLPVTADIPKAYEQGSDDEQEFVQNLAIFLTGFLKVLHVCDIGLSSCKGWYRQADVQLQHLACGVSSLIL